MTVRATPVPISNTMVKPYGADDTAREAVWKSKLTPVHKNILMFHQDILCGPLAQLVRAAGS